MTGLCHINEIISRDEGLHTEIDVLMHHNLSNKCDDEEILEIIKEAVTIVKEFITESLPCKIIGINNDLMKQYI